MGADRKQDRNRKKKPKFISQSPTRYLQQVDSVMWDEELTADQRIHALNSIRRDSMRQYGFYSDGYERIERAITAALRECRGAADGT